jgi:glycerophosphoryl diester phosphodiesterase
LRTSPAEALLRLKRTLVIAHRGFSSIAPENTLDSFQKAVIAGVDLVELDYHRTRDGRLIVIHDSTVDRTTDARKRWNGKGFKVADHDFEKLRELEAGNWFKPPHPGLHLPELGEALDVIQKGSVALIERKAGNAAACIQLIRDENLLNKVVIQSFDWDYLRDYHAEEQTQILAALGPPGKRNGRKLTIEEKQLNADWCDEIRDLGARVVAWTSQLNRTSVRAAHKRGLKVFVYTIDDSTSANDLFGMSVDGIISNNPTMLWKVLASRGTKRR